MILAADIGGTSSRLAAFEFCEGRWTARVEEVFPSARFASLEEIASRFVTRYKLSISRACFGVAGPVCNGQVKTPNLAWTVEASRLAAMLGLPKVSLINDLEANAWGVAALRPEELATINPGAIDAEGNIAIISAGTGLGEAGLIWDGHEHRPFACEGGHADLAPRTPLEAELLAWLWERFGHASYERVVSGPGLANIYRFLRERDKSQPSKEVEAQIGLKDLSAVISQSALSGSDPVCMQAMELFVGFYGAEAGNLALKMMSTGGVFLGGGIAPKILPKLQSQTFVEAFLGKGRLRPLLEAMPVRVILNDKTALLGAARCAAAQ